jgi:hypothetical protein
MMVKTFSWIAAGAIVIAACSGTGTEEGSSNTDTTAASAATETTAPTPVPTTATPTTAPTELVTTTEPASTTSTTTTTEPPGEVNPPDVEAWWCSAFEVAAGQSPVDFAQALADDFRHGYSEVPADSLEEAADQAVLVACDPQYGRAVAAALGA